MAQALSHGNAAALSSAIKKPPQEGAATSCWLWLYAGEIGAAGFEPTTPTTPKWCATKLRYAPADGSYHSVFRGWGVRPSLFSSRWVKRSRAMAA